MFLGNLPNLASAYISGISVGILLRSPAYWPYALCSAIAIVSKYVIRVHGRHIWNPSNFAICVMLLLAPEYRSDVEYSVGQHVVADGDHLGAGGFHRLPAAPLPYHGDLRDLFRGFGGGADADHGPSLAEVSPITGPMYQLFLFFMITDPKTTVAGKWAQCVVAALVAVVEMILRLAQVVNAPFFALFLVGPVALLIEQWLDSRKLTTARAAA